MLKTKRFLLTVLVIMMCVSIVFAAFACKDKTTEPTVSEEVEVEDTLILNGHFTKTTSAADAAFPHTPENWTGTPGATTSSYKTPQESSDLVAGIIDINNAGDFGGNPNKPEPSTNKDNKVLVIHNKTNTSYRFVSKNVSIEKEKYYKLTVFVKTKDVDKGGAYIQVTGSTYALFPAITTADWKKYEVYFKGSNASNLSIQVALGLGYGVNNEHGVMTKGYAYYDNVTLVESTQEDYDTATASESVKKCDLNFVDPTMDYASSHTSTPYTPAQFSGKGGTGSGTAANTGSSYLERGIIDSAIEGDSRSFTGASVDPVDLSAAPNATGTRMLYINNKQPTAYSYKDNLGILIEKGKYYEVSVWVRAFISEGKGASVCLVSSSGDALAKVENITSSDWEKITLYAEGNEFINNTLNVELCLGTGGSGDKNFVTGVVFFDELQFKTIEKEDYDAVLDDTKKASLSINEGDLIEIKDSTFEFTQYNKTFLDNAVTTEVKPLYSNKEITTQNIYGADQGVLKVTNERPYATSVSTFFKKKDAAGNIDVESKIVDETNKNLLVINPNTAYEVSFCVKTEDIVDSQSASIDLISYDLKKNEDYDAAFTTVQSITNVNSVLLKDYTDSNGYTRYTVYIFGKASEPTFVGFRITLGSGTSTMQSSSFVKGSIYLTNIRLQQIDYSKFTTVSTSTIVFRTSLGSSASSSTTGQISGNGNFELIDTSTTNSTFSSETNPSFNDNGELVGYAAPQSWTLTNSKALSYGAQAGVIDLNYNELTTGASAKYSLDPTSPEYIYAGIQDLTIEKAPRLLVISTQDSPESIDFGFSSQTISLEANSYYMFSIYANVENGEFTFNVTPSGQTADRKDMIIANNAGWNNYIILIKTGITSISVKASIYAGDATNTSTSGANTVYFTQANYKKITESVYNSLENRENKDEPADIFANRIKTLEWYTDRMNSTTTSNALATPSNWSGSNLDSSAPSDTDSLTKGIFNQTVSNWDNISINPDEYISDANTDSYKDILLDEARGDSVLVINNKNYTAYGYTSTAFTLSKDKYYKISIDVLTKDVAYLNKEDADRDETKYEKWTDKNLMNTATLTLKLNNYELLFGDKVQKDKVRDDFESDEEFELYELKKTRLINTDLTWQTYTFYIHVADDVTSSISGTLAISLGGKSVSYWAKGTVFADNFTFIEMTEEEYNTTTKANDATTHVFDFTEEQASAPAVEEEEETPEETPSEETPTPAESKDNFLWLYITSGIIGAIIVIILVIFIYKKYASKQKKFKKSKKTKISSDSTVKKFTDKK